jgi:ribokinase
LTPRITVVGSINLDLVARCERLPRPGETLTGATFARFPGGKGANQAVACARLGAEVTMIGAVGRDSEAVEALEGLREAGVTLELAESDEPTGVALILVDDAGETQIVVAPGANRDLGQVALPEHDAVLCQLEIPNAAVEVAWEKCEGVFCLNAAPARPVAVDADLTVVNRYELETVTRRDGLLAVTLGAEGAVLYEDGEEVARAAPPPVDAVDGTAAGDAFTACLLVSLLDARAHDDALVRACAAGALAASRPGAQSSLPTVEEIDAILTSP